jgi:hypothetical protein
MAGGVRDTVEPKCPEPKIDNEHGLQDAGNAGDQAARKNVSVVCMTETKNREPHGKRHAMPGEMINEERRIRMRDRAQDGAA